MVKSAMERKVAIVGAGVSGLAACKHLLDKGFLPIVYEASNSIGGVWTRTLQSTRLQATAAAYRFSDHPWPPDVTDKYPSHTDVMRYIKSYADRFGLLACCRFNCRVTDIDYVGVPEEEVRRWELWSGNGEAFGGPNAGEWRLTLNDVEHGTTEIAGADFIVLCIGRHSGYPNIPDFSVGSGPELFRGTVMHSLDYADMPTGQELLAGKRIAVVGSGKSAFDIAAECANLNGPAAPCTMVFRTKHWLVPEDDIWGINLGYFYLNRISQLLVRKPGGGFLENMLASMLSPLRWWISKAIEGHLLRRVPLREHQMVPEYSFSQAISACLIAKLPEGFYDRVGDGSIVLKNSKKFRFCQEGLILEDTGGEVVDADAVILATGFRGDQKLLDVFASPYFRKIIAGSPESPLPLYRECVHPEIPQLAIVGYSESLTDLYASERMSDWVAHLLAGSFSLPSVRRMRDDVGRWSEYKKQYNKQYFRRSAISTVNIWFNDLLCRDIGRNPRRKSGWLAEWFEPYGPADYAGVQ